MTWLRRLSRWWLDLVGDERWHPVAGADGNGWRMRRRYQGGWEYRPCTPAEELDADWWNTK